MFASNHQPFSLSRQTIAISKRSINQSCQFYTMTLTIQNFFRIKINGISPFRLATFISIQDRIVIGYSRNRLITTGVRFRFNILHQPVKFGTGNLMLTHKIIIRKLHRHFGIFPLDRSRIVGSKNGAFFPRHKKHVSRKSNFISPRLPFFFRSRTIGTGH